MVDVREIRLAECDVRAGKRRIKLRFRQHRSGWTCRKDNFVRSNAGLQQLQCGVAQRSIGKYFQRVQATNESTASILTNGIEFGKLAGTRSLKIIVRLLT